MMPILEIPFIGLLCPDCAGIRPKLRARLLIAWNAPEAFPCTCPTVGSA